MEMHHPNWNLGLELFSTLPLDRFLQKKPKQPLKIILFCFFHLKDCFKCLRIVHAFRYHQDLRQRQKITIALLEFIVYLNITVMIMYYITYQSVASQNEVRNYSEILYISIVAVTTYGHVVYPNSTLWMICTISIGFAFFILTGYFKGVVIWTICETNSAAYKFRFKYFFIQSEQNRLYISQDEVETTKRFCQTSWKLQNIHIGNWKMVSVLPPSMNKELSVEIFWFALMHSKLFRNFDLPFLRPLSMSLKSEMKIAGEIIYEKGVTKNKMVYVQTGVIQILSEEDDETPIFSFSGGTCLGESGLILGYRSNSIVRCKTSCRLHILYQKDYIKAARVKPKEFAKIRQAFYKRLSDAKENRALSKEINERYYTNERINYMTVMWLKSTLHNLMAKDEVSLEKHSCQNIFLRAEFDEDKFKDRHFTADNLDLIAISERLELVTDSVFLKSSCPCILQPRSIFLTAWNSFIVILACTVGVIVPYYAFLHVEVPVWYELYIIVVTLLWGADLYFEISTAVKTRDRIIARVRDICEYRINTFPFFLDLFAAIPSEMFSTILLTEVSRCSILMLEMNRVVKIHKLWGIYTNWKNNLTSKNIFITYLWYQLCCLYIAYIFSCILFYVVNSTDFKYTSFKWCLLSIYQILNGVSVANPLSRDALFFSGYIVTCISASFINLLYFSYVNAIFCMEKLITVKKKDLFHNTIITVKSNTLMSKFEKRILKNVEARLQGADGFKILNGYNPYITFPSSIYSKFAQEMYEGTLCSIPFFQNLPKQLTAELSSYCNVSTIPPNEVLCSTGQILNDLLILESGYCNVHSPIASAKTDLKAVSGLALLEAYTSLPVVDTIVTATHCRLLTVALTDFSAVLLRYPVEKSLIDSSLSEKDVINKLNHFYHISQKNTTYQHASKSNKKKSFKLFGYNLPIDSFEEYDYYVPFDRLRHFAFIQYFLMRVTILPSSVFLLIWEIIRCLCAVASTILFSLIHTNVDSNSNWQLSTVMACLDAMAWADIYVRFHVCYYNEKGILVTHPLATAKYYLKHAFIIDVLGVFPFKLISNSDNFIILSSLQLNRALQMYRLMGLSKIIVKKQIISPLTLLFFQYFSIFLTLSFFISYFIFDKLCSIVNSTSNFEFSCSNSTFYLELLNKQIFGVYVVASIITESGLQGYEVHDEDPAISIAILTLIKNILIACLTCHTIRLCTTRVSNIWAYQNSMWMVLDFMQKFKIHFSLQQDLISHFEIKWFRFKGTNVATSISQLHGALKQDILYNIYGDVLENSSMFLPDSDCKHYFRSLLLEVTHDMVTKNGFVTKINDINKHINIIYKGTALVIAADNSKIGILAPGSMFGNLSENEMTRQTVSIRAIGHIEILVVKTTTFFQTLKKYSRLYKRYKRLTSFHSDFLESRSESTDNDDEIIENQDQGNDSSNHKLSVFSKVFNPKMLWLQVWNFVILVVVCYLESTFTLYQIAVGEYRLPFILFQYICDLLFIINYYIKNHTAYENLQGTMVYDLKIIHQRLTKNRTMYYFEIFSLMPFDFLTWFFPGRNFRILHSMFRLNRPFRFLFLYNYLKQFSEMLHFNSAAMSTVRIVVSYVFLINTCAASVLLLSCLFDFKTFPQCIGDTHPPLEKFKRFISLFYTMYNIFTGTAQSQVYPVSSVLIVHYIIVMISLAILRAIFLGLLYVTLQMHYSRRIEYRRKTEVIKGDMDQEQISSALYTKISNYLQLLWRTEKGVVYPNILQEAPYCLREAILCDAFGDHINYNCIFAKCHRDFNRQLVTKLLTQRFFKGDYVVFKGAANGFMYFIHEGTVQVLGKDDEVHILKDGYSFGAAQGLFPGKSFLYSFQAVTPTIVLILDFKKWEFLMNFFPASKNKIYEQYYINEDRLI